MKKDSCYNLNTNCDEDNYSVSNTVGPRGPRGEMGCPGIKGDTGSRGPQGPQGEIGIEGPRGQRGLEGEKGDRGLAGCRGAQGPQGNIGTTGSKGAQGVRGDVGPKGDQGFDGIKGPRGNTGIHGPVGPVGPRGPQGDLGETGSRGSEGDQGPEGVQGLIGVQGLAGPQGDQGVTGPQGYQGDRGCEGPQGTQGESGTSAVIPFASGTPIALTTIDNVLPGLPGIVAFGTSATLTTVLDTRIDATNIPNLAFSMPMTGLITSFTAYFSTSKDLDFKTQQATITAEIYVSSTPNNIFELVPESVLTLATTYTGLSPAGTNCYGIIQGLNIEILPQTRILVVFSATSTGEDHTQIIEGTASAGIAIS